MNFFVENASNFCSESDDALLIYGALVLKNTENEKKTKSKISKFQNVYLIEKTYESHLMPQKLT